MEMNPEFPSGLTELELCDWLIMSAMGAPKAISSTQATVSGHEIPALGPHTMCRALSTHKVFIDFPQQH